MPFTAPVNVIVAPEGLPPSLVVSMVESLAKDVTPNCIASPEVLTYPAVVVVELVETTPELNNAISSVLLPSVTPPELENVTASVTVKSSLNSTE